jgi:hypothetical protein
MAALWVAGNEIFAADKIWRQRERDRCSTPMFHVR